MGKEGYIDGCRMVERGPSSFWP